MRLALWASLPVIVNIWTSGFSGKVLPCKTCRKSRVTQPNPCFWLMTLQATCHEYSNSDDRGIPFSVEKFPSGLGEQIAVEFSSSADLLGRPRPSGRFHPSIPGLCPGIALDEEVRCWPRLAQLSPGHGCCSWCQLHPILRKGWVMPSSPVLLQSRRCCSCLVTCVVTSLIILTGWSSHGEFPSD